MNKIKIHLKLTILVAILFFNVEVNAQFRAMITPSLEIPIVSSVNPGYKLTPGIKGGIFYEIRKFSFGLSVGYHTFTPNEEVLNKRGLPIFRVDGDPESFETRSCDTCNYTEEFGNLSMVPILIEWNMYLLKTDHIKLSFGINSGIRIYSYSHEIRLANQIDKYYGSSSYNYYSYSNTPPSPEMIDGKITTKKTDARINMSPKLAFEYMLNDKFSIYFEPAINLQTGSIGDFFMSDDFNDPFFSDYGVFPGGYTINQMFTASLGVGVIYNFGYPAKVAARKEEKEKIKESEKIEWLPE